MLDLCDDLKFPNLEDDFHITEKRGEVISFIDEENNVWIKKKKIQEGGYGKVIEFKSHNPEYADLAVKFFTAEAEEAYEDMQQEAEVVNLFNKYRCKNFIKIGVKEIMRNEKIIIMEKIDGDVYGLNFEKFPNPLKVYQKLIQFIVSGLRCGIRRDRYFVDFKEENMGYKNCKEGIRFTFLDFGSFVDINDNDYAATYLINSKAYDKDYFPKETLMVFSIIITLLNIRLKIQSKNQHEKFDEYISYLKHLNNYPRTTLLTEDYYQKIKENFFEYFKKEDRFIDILFSCLRELTFSKPDVRRFLTKIDYYK